MVSIDTGAITGVATGPHGAVEVFRGIPYAAPPVGDLRWKPPRPPIPWEGALACTAFAPACPQPKAMIWPIRGPQSEDCLHLNVWRPAATGQGAATTPADARGAPPRPPLPVMVWIHGGAFVTGTGGSAFYDGESLARQGVIVVTIDYRLGPFGFLAHPLLSKESPDGVSGNYGLLDQIAALRWVKRNIAAFGGDPGCVTIFGESAGAVSVCRLLVSPMARGLFHRAIAQSGAARGRSRHLREATGEMPSMEADGVDLARRLGCADAADPLACLRSKSAAELLAAAEPSQGIFGAGMRFGPVVDGKILPDDADRLFEEGHFAPVPLIAGTNADEGTIFLAELPIRRVAGYELLIRRRFGDHADEALALYPAATDAGVPAALVRVVTDAAFVAPARALARQVSGHEPGVFLYHLTRVSPGGAKSRRGAFHASDLAYVFNRTANPAAYDDTDRELARVMSACWVRFARTGDPNGPGLPEWPAFDAARDRYLEFGDRIQSGSGLRRAACDFLDRIYAARSAQALTGE